MEALSRAETFGGYDDALAYAAALRAPLGLAPDATVASVEAEMLGGDVGRMRRERWAEALGAARNQTRKLLRTFVQQTKTARAKLVSRRCSRRCSRRMAKAGPTGAKTAN